MDMSESIFFVPVDGKSNRSAAIRAHAARRGHQKNRTMTARQDAGFRAKPVKPLPGSPPPTFRIKPGRNVIKTVEGADGAGQDQRLEEVGKDQAIRARNQISNVAWRPVPLLFQAQPSLSPPERFVQMFFQKMPSSYTAAYRAFNVPDVIVEEWPRYMNHEVFLWTEASAIQGLYDSLESPSLPPSATAIKHESKALSGLKRELTKAKGGKLDDHLIMSIFVLAALSLMAGDKVSHNAHKQILRTAFAAAGGIHNFGPFVRNTTMRLESFWRSTTDEPKEPALPVLAPSRIPRLPTHPFAPELCNIIGKLPPGFQELALHKRLPIDVLEVLGRIADPSQKPLPHILSVGDNRSPQGSCGKYVDFWEACPSLSAPARDGEPALERLLSLALLIYSTNRDNTNPMRMYNCITNGAMYDLCFDLPQCRKQRSHEEECCVFWIWSVAVDAMRDRHSQLSPQGYKLFEQQEQRFPGVIGTDLEEKVLERFWFASKASTGSCLSEYRPVHQLSRQASNLSTGTMAESLSSPSASIESMDNWDVPTPVYEQDGKTVDEKGLGFPFSEKESAVSQLLGPGFGLWPRARLVKELPEPSYGTIRLYEDVVVKCLGV